MKLYLNYKGPKVGTGKIDIENINELLTLEKALNCYKDNLLNASSENAFETQHKIEKLNELIDILKVSNAEKIVKRFENNVGIGLTEFLRKKRLERNMSIKDIAQKLNVKPSYYNDVEKENIEPPALLLIKIFDMLNLLSKIKVKLYDYIPAIEYYYEGIKITEVYFKFNEDYIHDRKILKDSLTKESIQQIKFSSNILYL